MANLKELSKKEASHILTPGHRLCAGCAAPIIVRQVSMSQDVPLVVGLATGCLEVSTTIYPFSAWKCSYIHSAFENAAATVSGVETAYRALRKRGKIKDEFKFIAFGGDGGTYDIGLQSLSGAMERGHNMLYVCYDNEAYMNTGIQRSSATPKGAATTTAPAGEVVAGKTQFQKDLTGILAAHRIPYVAQASPSHWNDLITKAQKALSIEGPKFINVLSPCPPGWGYEASKTIEMAKLAVDTCFWPLFEVENGIWKVTYKPKEIKPLSEWVSIQSRFRHLSQPANKALIDELQAFVNKNWQDLLKKAGETV